ncbi:uncharacterized protein P884DRAFT_16758 [Thermothelomyces heterothallicus CBS 202.75]|uniref:uncharacterized protein n=1 Tax=Thermothelomyces heterothallicus CBS 202.75 TaxID=1149848 RepID=UPI003743CB3C
MLPAPSSSLVIRPIHDSSSRLPVLLGGASTCDSKGRLLQRLPSRLGLQLLSYSSILLPTRYIHTTLQSDSRCRPTLDKPPPSPLRQHIRPPVCSTVTHQRPLDYLPATASCGNDLPRLYQLGALPRSVTQVAKKALPSSRRDEGHSHSFPLLRRPCSTHLATPLRKLGHPGFGWVHTISEGSYSSELPILPYVPDRLLVPGTVVLLLGI